MCDTISRVGGFVIGWIGVESHAVASARERLLCRSSVCTGIVSWKLSLLEFLSLRSQMSQVQMIFNYAMKHHHSIQNMMVRVRPGSLCEVERPP